MKDPTVKEFLKILRRNNACKDGIKRFMRGRGTVRQKLQRMCRMANGNTNDWLDYTEDLHWYVQTYSWPRKTNMPKIAQNYHSPYWKWELIS